jgi:hypothetical protein
MADRLTSKIAHTQELIAKTASGEVIPREFLDKEICSLWEWILFFQHERLIHLLVTILFALLTVGSFGLFFITQFLPIIALFLVFLVLLVPYIFYYYHLENGVQKLYDLYDQLKACRKD